MEVRAYKNSLGPAGPGASPESEIGRATCGLYEIHSSDHDSDMCRLWSAGA